MIIVYRIMWLYIVICCKSLGFCVVHWRPPFFRDLVPCHGVIGAGHFKTVWGGLVWKGKISGGFAGHLTLEDERTASARNVDTSRSVMWCHIPEWRRLVIHYFILDKFFIFQYFFSTAPFEMVYTYCRLLEKWHMGDIVYCDGILWYLHSVVFHDFSVMFYTISFILSAMKIV